MQDVFISYARKDRDTATRLVSLLKDRSFTVWWDAELLAQDRFRTEIERAITETSTTVVLWSADARDSRFVNDEAQYAQDAGKLIQVSLDGVPPPLGFGRAVEHFIDLSEWSGDPKEPAFAGLVSAINRRRSNDGKPTTEPPPEQNRVYAVRGKRAWQPAWFWTASIVCVALIAAAVVGYSVFQVGPDDLTKRQTAGQPEGLGNTENPGQKLSAVDAMQQAGDWVQGWNGKGDPPNFHNFFVFPTGNKSMAPGAIIIGKEDRGANLFVWTVIHGHHISNGPQFAPVDQVTYLGPVWQPWYKSLSSELFRLRGGQKMDIFEPGPPD